MSDVNEIVLQIKSWLAFHESTCNSEGLELSDDLHIMSPPVWPSRGVLKEWVRVLEYLAQARADVQRAVDSVQVPIAWFNDVVEFLRDGLETEGPMEAEHSIFARNLLRIVDGIGKPAP
jgi:hypothetical protein